MTTHTLSLGPLSLLATQTGPLLTITIHAPSDSAPVGKMTLAVPEWTALVALVDCMGVADGEMTKLRNELSMLRAATTRIVDVSDPEQCDHNRQVDPDTGECLDCGTALP